MQLFQNLDSGSFKFNGKRFVKNFIVMPVGDDALTIYNAYDSRLQLMPPTHFSNIRIGGVEFPSQQLLIDELAPMLFAKQLVSLTGLEQDQLIDIDLERIEDEIIISAGGVWRLSGDLYGNEFGFVYAVPSASSGETRIDIIVANNEGWFEVIQGTEDEENPASPVVPNGTLLVTTITVIGETIIEESPYLIPDAYVTKLESHELEIYYQGVLNHFILPSYMGAIRMIGTCSQWNAVSFNNVSNQALYSGKKFIVKNFQALPIRLKHNYGSVGTFKFFFPNGQDLILEPNHIAEFSLSFSSSKLEYIGQLQPDFPNHDLQTILDNGNTAHDQAITLYGTDPSEETQTQIYYGGINISQITDENGDLQRQTYLSSFGLSASDVLGYSSTYLDQTSLTFTLNNSEEGIQKYRKLVLSAETSALSGTTFDNVQIFRNSDGFIATEDYVDEAIEAIGTGSQDLQATLENGSSGYGHTILLKNATNSDSKIELNVDDFAESYIKVENGAAGSGGANVKIGSQSLEFDGQGDYINRLYPRGIDTSIYMPSDNGELATRQWVTGNTASQSLVNSLSGAVTGLTSQVTTLNASVSGNASQLLSLSGVVTGITGQLSALSGMVSGHTSQITALQTKKWVTQRFTCLVSNLADSTTYSIHSSPYIPTATILRTMPAMMTGTITDCVGAIHPNGSGSNEQFTIQVRNVTTNQVGVITTTALANGADCPFSGTISLPVTKGDSLVLQLIAPIWATNPTNVAITCDILLQNF